MRKFQDSETSENFTLLNQTELGNQCPSRLLRHMRDLAQNKVFTKMNFSNLYGCNVSQLISKQSLSTSEDSLEKLATMADWIYDIVSTNICLEVTSIAAGTSFWEGQLYKIIKRLDRMKSKRHKASPRRRERSASASSGHC